MARGRPGRSRGRRIRRAAGWSLAGTVGLVAAFGILEAGTGPGQGVPAAASAPVAVPGVTTASPTPPAGVEAVTVTRVVDGDTFRVGTRRIRVLGIDSCEADTAAGPAATAEASALLAGRQVTLGAEPGVNLDVYGRELRYVRLPDGRDFATAMVAATHTAVYAGRNDANPGYVAGLRAADPNGRNCGPTPVTAPARHDHPSERPPGRVHA